MCQQSDKGNKLTISEFSSYQRQSEQHIKEDREISEEDILEVQKVMNQHGRAIANIVGLGSSHPGTNSKRCWTAMSTMAAVVPIEKLLPKIHKEKDENNYPRTRPVAGERSCITSRPGDLIADLVGAAVRVGPRLSVNSTKDATANIEMAREKITSLSSL